jgi:two-component system, OmpR family, sensor kinase
MTAGNRRRPGRCVPRGLRGRLTLTYTLAAALFVAAGAAVFLLALRAGLRANLDDTLRTRAATLAASVSDPGGPDLPDRADSAVAHTRSSETVAGYVLPDGKVALLPGSWPGVAPAAAVVDAARRHPVHVTVVAGTESFRLVASPVGGPGGVWVAFAGASEETIRAAGAAVRRYLLVGGPVVVVLVAVGSWLLAGAALRPVDRMRRDAAELAGRRDGGRLAVPGTGDELAALASTLNALLAGLQASVARQRDLVADAGHELRTPLAVLRAELELAGRPGRSRGELRDAVGHATVEVDRLCALADDLLFLARADGGGPLVHPEPADLSAVLGAAARAARARADELGVALVVDSPDRLRAVIDPAAVRRAVDNLLTNALDHSPTGGRVRLAGRPYRGESNGAGSRVSIAVEDGGPGFPPQFLPHAFERFRRADVARAHGDSQTGTGLGLAIVAEIAAAHGGAVSADNRPAGGALVTLTLPRDGNPVSDPPPPA